MTPHTLFTAICNVKKMPLQEALAQDKVWLHTTNDIFMVSTPEQVRARSYAQITLIPISMSSTDATAYLALPNGAVRDVIHMTHNAAQVHSYHRLGVQPEAGRGRTTEFSFPKSDRVQLAKTAMANKMSEDAGAAVHEEALHSKGTPLHNCWGFIDGTAICRPSEDQLFFSGRKWFHVLKYQAIMCPNGIICQLNGPYVGSHHDAGKFTLLMIVNIYS
ncbi:uncharacterized protein [Dermacentor albipictus]|uniref:uncharacterized protein isoform X1 n=1 Tax=Dermacentor albipictus TaxID=60249 RepID=UPI0038FCB250